MAQPKTSIIGLVFCIMLGSCTASWHLNQAILKDPSIIASDTVIRIDTVFISVKNIDTVFKYTVQDTTIIVNQDSVIVKYFYNHTDSTVFLQADCPDCPQITKEITNPTLKITPPIWEQMKNVWWSYLILVLIVAGVAFYILIKNTSFL